MMPPLPVSVFCPDSATPKKQAMWEMSNGTPCMFWIVWKRMPDNPITIWSTALTVRMVRLATTYLGCTSVVRLNNRTRNRPALRGGVLIVLDRYRYACRFRDSQL